MEISFAFLFGALMSLLTLSNSQSCDEFRNCSKNINPKLRKRYTGSEENILAKFLGGETEEKSVAESVPRIMSIYDFGFNDEPDQEDDVDFGINDVNDRCGTYYTPTVPDFSRSGQRISITKCYEYIWELNVRIERKKRATLCSGNFFKPRYDGSLVTKGIRAVERQFPHMGAVGWNSSEPFRKWKFMCGCTLISSKFVLTAAHCSRAGSNVPFIADLVPKIVRFGARNIISSISADSREDRNIARIINHPQYKSPSKYYDIALIELDRIIQFTPSLQPSCLWSGDFQKIPNATIAGWGVTRPGEHEGSADLLYGSINIIDSTLCDTLLMSQRNRLWNGLRDHQFCAGELEGGVDACQGDSGGPLQINIRLPAFARDEGIMHYILGVTSFGSKCGKENMPGIYTKVSYFIDWIEKHVWG